jgi:hypothetical protein
MKGDLAGSPMLLRSAAMLGQSDTLQASHKLHFPLLRSRQNSHINLFTLDVEFAESGDVLR